jgi:hypothetical protein
LRYSRFCILLRMRKRPRTLATRGTRRTGFRAARGVRRSCKGRNAPRSYGTEMVQKTLTPSLAFQRRRVSRTAGRILKGLLQPGFDYGCYSIDASITRKLLSDQGQNGVCLSDRPSSFRKEFRHQCRSPDRSQRCLRVSPRCQSVPLSRILTHHRRPFRTMRSRGRQVVSVTRRW